MFIFGFSIFAIVFFIFLLILLARSVYLVRQAEAVVIEQLGKFQRVLNPGVHFVIPFVQVARSVVWTFVREDERARSYYYSQTVTRIDLREAVYDFPKQNVITRDNVTIEINALLYYQITSPKAAVYEVFDLPRAIEQLTQTTLRDVIGSMDFDQTLASRGLVNEKLRIILDEATDKWGVKINRVELKEINPPADIRHAMEKQMRAERDRRATILESEGKKSAAILEAEGELESQVLCARGEAESRILRAEGEAQARLKSAEAEARAIKMIQEAVPGKDPLAYLVALQYIKMLPELTKGSAGKTVVIPYETSSLMSSVTTIKELFK